MRAWIAVLGFLSFCSPAGPSQQQSFVVASTTSTQDSGFLDAMAPEFEKTNPGLRAKVVAVGSGEAIELARRGDADVLLAHSPEDEQRFMAEGKGIFRDPVMSNDFIVAGPRHDPASIGEGGGAAQVFGLVAESQSVFVSRGDQSGTHRREMEVWAESGSSPQGPWYLQSGQGMAETLMIASEKSAYVLSDSATFAVMAGRIDVIALFSGDPLLVNRYSVIPVKGAKQRQAALEFARWLTGPPGQKFIRDFGRKEYGTPLFSPASDADDARRSS